MLDLDTSLLLVDVEYLCPSTNGRDRYLTLVKMKFRSIRKFTEFGNHVIARVPRAPSIYRLCR